MGSEMRKRVEHILKSATLTPKDDEDYIDDIRRTEKVYQRSINGTAKA
jgi:hypothetical protein